MNWCEVLNSFTSNILSAIAIGFVAWLFAWTRNHFLERQLSKSINAGGIGMTWDPIAKTGGFSIQVHNYSNTTVRVRSVLLMAGMLPISLTPRRPRVINQTPLLNEFCQKNFRRRLLSLGTFEDDGNPDAVVLHAKTMSIWEIDPDTLASQAWKITRAYLVIEYNTWLGRVALTRVEANAETIKHIKSLLEPLSEALHHKNFDVLAQMFTPPPNATH